MDKAFITLCAIVAFLITCAYIVRMLVIGKKQATLSLKIFNMSVNLDIRKEEHEMVQGAGSTSD